MTNRDSAGKSRGNSPNPPVLGNIAADDAVKCEARSDHDKQHEAQQDRVPKASDSSHVPFPGRKRAFSDPGDVKRPSTAGTDRRPGALGRENPPTPDSSIPRASPRASTSGESFPQRPPPPLGPTYMSFQAPAAAPFAFPAYMSPERPMQYEGLTHGVLPGVSRERKRLSIEISIVC